jgi:hypothetical protein
MSAEPEPVTATPDPYAALTPEQRAMVEDALLFSDAMEADKAAGRSLLIPQKPYGRQKLFLEDLKDVYEAFYGGAAGGGKSSTMLMAALEFAHVPHYAALILRRTYKDLALPGAIMDRAKSWLIGKPGVHWDGDLHTFTFSIPPSEEFPKGGKSTLTFGYLATEVDKYQYQGAELQFVGYDELTQFEETQYTYLFSRLRRPAIPCAKCHTPMEKAGEAWLHKNVVDCDWHQPNVESEREFAGVYALPLRMRAAANPGGVGHEWVKARFIPEDYLADQSHEARVWDKEGVDDDGISFHTYFVPSRVQDNPFVDQQSYIEGLGRLDRVTRLQLLKGDWAISPTGECYFNFDALERFQSVQPAVGEIVEIDLDFNRSELRFLPKPGGLLALWKKPERGHCYVIGCDTASGKDANKGEGKVDRDWSVSQVFDIDSGEQVARLRGRISERYFGEYWARLSKFYNGAFVVPAVTGGYGRAALNRAIDCHLPFDLIYQPEDETGIPGRRKAEGSELDLGFTESSATRPSLYSALDLAIIEAAITIYDAVTINECYSFEYNKDGKPIARSGTKDDCVTALALAVKGIRVAPAWLRARMRSTRGDVASLPRKWGQAVDPRLEERQRMLERQRNSMAEFRRLQRAKQGGQG